MSYTYLRAAGEESLAECFSDIEPSALLKLNITAEKFCCKDNVTESCHTSQSGMTSERSTENRGEEKSILSQEASLVRTSALAGPVLESKEHEADYGEKWPEWFAKLDRASSSWKIRQLWLFADLDESLAIWPKWGMMRDGVCMEQLMLGLPTTEIESGYSLPTPTKCDHSKVSKNTQFWSRRLEEGRTGMDNLPEFATTIYPDGGGRIHPLLHEWLMGWPAGMTDLKPQATDKFQAWLRSHSKS